MKAVDSAPASVPTYTVEELLKIAGTEIAGKSEAERLQQVAELTKILRTQSCECKQSSRSLWRDILTWFESPALGWATACLAVGFVVFHQSNKTAFSDGQSVAAIGEFGGNRTRSMGPEKTRGPGGPDAPMAKVNISLKWETGVITFTDTTGVHMSGHFKPEEPRPSGAQPGVEYYSVVAAGFQFGPNSRTNDWLLTGTMSLTRSPGTNAPSEAELQTLQVRGVLFEQGSAKGGGDVTFSGPRATKP